MISFVTPVTVCGTFDYPFGFPRSAYRFMHDACRGRVMRAGLLKTTRIVLRVRNRTTPSATVVGGRLGRQAYGHDGREGVGRL
ncbi:hypothetical protein GCM10010182_38720 [Actinomadura cremea]|nr:hypothetical protein GCM10010182_38720 [Actinomadura cremea]